MMDTTRRRLLGTIGARVRRPRVRRLRFGERRASVEAQAAADRVTFDDVAGVDEAVAELREVVDFLASPEPYRALGARIPRGVLLVGPPGTGKTLLARAVAGEANVPFFAISAAEFVELFVGVGSARVRDLFDQARDHAPCIVFIDELDAIGKSRTGMGAIVTHEERELTLHQLLVEMDGFDGGHGVVIMAATSRPEVLDPALRRAGRFDRQITLDRPDLRGRDAILRVHARRLVLDASVDLHRIAQRTSGMVGADLANVVNEAAIAAARRRATAVAMVDFEAAVDRIVLGLERQRAAIGDEDKARIAVHEAGHAIATLALPHADPLHRVTIIPRSIGTLGSTLQLPTEDRRLYTREELLDRIAVLLAGRAAEELLLGSPSTGVEQDLERASELARRMVRRYGMSSRLGLVSLGGDDGDDRACSERTREAIDLEVHAILEAQRRRVAALLDRHRTALELLVSRLLFKESVDRAEVERLWAAAIAAADDGEPRVPAALGAEADAALPAPA